MSDNPAKTRGAHHVGLTVPDLRAARDFFVDALGFAEVGELPDYPAVFVSDGAITITLWQAECSDTWPFPSRGLKISWAFGSFKVRKGSRSSRNDTVG